jgi:hypothetical protein
MHTKLYNVLTITIIHMDVLHMKNIHVNLKFFLLTYDPSSTMISTWDSLYITTSKIISYSVISIEFLYLHNLPVNRNCKYNLVLIIGYQIPLHSKTIPKVSS